MQALVWDLDGTLVDTLDDIAEAMNRVLDERGLPTHDRDAFRYFVGAGARSLVKRALPADRRGETSACLARFRQIYDAALTVRSRPYAGVEDTLAALAARGTPMCVLSNKPHAMTVRVVRRFFPEVPFVEVAGQRPGIPRKPDPTAALAQIRLMQRPASAVGLIGDTGSDMEAAVAAGAIGVGVGWGFRARDELVAAGATRVVARPEELLELTA